MRRPRNRWGSAIVALVALTAFGAIGVCAAQADSAPKWKVNGAYLAENASRAFTGKNTEILRLNVPAAGLTFESPAGECGIAGKIVGSKVEQPGTSPSVVIGCNNMTLKGWPACTVKTPGLLKGEVNFNLLTGTLVWLNSTNEPAGDRLLPETGAIVSETALEGFCPVKPATYAVEGPVIGQIKPVAASKTPIALEFPEPFLSEWWNNKVPRQKQISAQLTFGKLNATLQTAFSMALTTGETIGVFAG